MSVELIVEHDLSNDAIAKALEKCDWSGASIGNKAIICLAIDALRNNRPTTDAELEVVSTQWEHRIAYSTNTIWTADQIRYGNTSEVSRKLVTLAQASSIIADKDVEAQKHAHAYMLEYQSHEATKRERDALKADIAGKDAANFANQRAISRMAQKIENLVADNERLRKINANLMGDDEGAPRYTTKRLKQEIAKAVETATADKDARMAELVATEQATFEIAARLLKEKETLQAQLAKVEHKVRLLHNIVERAISMVPSSDDLWHRHARATLTDGEK